MSVKGGLAIALISLKNQFGTDEIGAIRIELSRKDIASVVGATYETVFRIINKLIVENTIITTKRNIRILDEKKLQSFAREES